MKTLLITLVLALIIPMTSFAAHKNVERYYQDIWCAEQNGEAEIILQDKTRCDCITKTHAIEVDFAPKFYEALGQALYYAMHTGKRAGIMLIIEEKTDYKYHERLLAIIAHYGLPVDVWTVINIEE